MPVRFKEDLELRNKIRNAVQDLPTTSPTFKELVGVVARTFEKAFDVGISYNDMTKIIRALNELSSTLCLVYEEVVESVPKQTKVVVPESASDPVVTLPRSPENLPPETTVPEHPGSSAPEEIEEISSEIASTPTNFELDPGVCPPGLGLQSPPGEVTEPGKPIQVNPALTTGANAEPLRQASASLSGKLALLSAFLVVTACVVLIFFVTGYGSSGTKQIETPDAQFYFAKVASPDEHARYENGPKLSQMDSKNPIYKISPRDQVVLTFRVPPETKNTDLRVVVVSPTEHTGTRTHSSAIYGQNYFYRDPDDPRKLTFPNIESSAGNRYAFEETAGWYGFILTTTSKTDVTHFSSPEIDLSNEPGPERFIVGIAEKMPTEILDRTPNRGIIEGNTAIPKIKKLVSEIAANNRVEVLSYLFVFIDKTEPQTTPEFME